jgi:hypothetical protein
MASNLLDKRLGDTLEAALSDASGDVYFVNPSASAIEEYVQVASDGDFDVHVRLIAEYRSLKTVLEDFIVASTAADLAADGHLTLRTVEDPPANTLLVGDDRVVTLVDAGERIGALVTDDASFVSETHESYGERWAAAEEYSLRTPPISEVRDSLSGDLSDDAREDFDGVLQSLETARGDGDGLDEVTISLLIAARNEELLYDVSKWGEDVGLASKATFSRTKTKLEDMGMIDTEKVPIDVGRPRLRLKLGDDRLESAETDQLATVAQSILT